MEQFLGAHTRTDDPKRLWNLTCENRDQKRARRFNDMRKGHRTHAFAQRLQLARDRLRVGDDF